ncbi:MAG TPA: mechanosensitive ion channel domain-containing protein [Gaiellaceae bacterium]|nr:mechanosensitive ion channel domain-containing protein [Gaiellaceae bacterium]
MPIFWQRVLIAIGAIVVASLIAKLIDWRIARKNLTPEAVTRYRVLRRTLYSAIIFVGVMSALLVIPGVRAIAGGVLASSAVVGLVIGFASQRTIGNAVAGVLIAITQPLRIGDHVEVEGVRGIVEEIGLTYTWIRTRDNDRLVVPNEKLASQSIRNSTIRSQRMLAEVTVQLPKRDLREHVKKLEQLGDEVYVTDVTGDNASVLIRTWVSSEHAVEAAESELRLKLAEQLA